MRATRVTRVIPPPSDHRRDPIARTRARQRRLTDWLAGAVAGCPGLEEVRTEPGGRPSLALGSEHEERDSAEDDTDPQEGDLVSVTDRIGLGCYLFPGCGAFLSVLLVPGILVALVRSLLRSG